MISLRAEKTFRDDDLKWLAGVAIDAHGTGGTQRIAARRDRRRGNLRYGQRITARRPGTVAGHLENAANLRNRVTDMAETETDDTSKLAPNVLVGEIERTRDNLARTIDAIADRVSPSNVARRAGDRARDRISQIDPLIGGAVALAAVSVTCYMVWRRLRK
jgi:hypothetical protein